MYELSDRFLIENCNKLQNASMPAFIRDETKISLFQLLNDLGPGVNISTDSFDKHHFLWKSLLSDAISYLKLHDKREFEKDQTNRERDKVSYGVNDLYSYYKEYRDFEALLYGADQFYRDHITHVFRVWFIGNWIIENYRTIAWDYHDLVEEDNSLSISEEEVFAIWCIIALSHDLGYPLDKIDKIKNKINSMMSYFGGATYGVNDFQIPSHHHFINDFILKFVASKLIRSDHQSKDSGIQKCIVSRLLRSINRSKEYQYKTAVQSKYYLKFSKSLENYHHGIITCILLMKNLIYFLESDMDLVQPFPKTEDARQFYIRREILRAIAGHTSTDIYHLYPNALSFILILADELQVWERPTFQEIKSGRQRLTIKSFVDTIDKSNISILLEIDEIEPGEPAGNGAEAYFKSICRKWMKWLRGALDAGKRPFIFSITGRILSKGNLHKEICFKNEPMNKFIYSEGGNELGDVISALYDS